MSSVQASAIRGTISATSWSGPSPGQPALSAIRSTSTSSSKRSSPSPMPNAGPVTPGVSNASRTSVPTPAGPPRMSQRLAIEAIIVRPSPSPGLSGWGVIPRPSSSTRTSTQPSPASAVIATRPRSRSTNAWMIALVTASETASIMLLRASSSAPWARAKSATPRRSSATTAGSASTSRCQRGGGAAIIGQLPGATNVNCVSVPVISNRRWTEGGPGTSFRLMS